LTLLEEFVSIQTRIKDFIPRYIYPDLVNIMEKIEDLKEKMLGRAPEIKRVFRNFL